MLCALGIVFPNQSAHFERGKDAQFDLNCRTVHVVDELAFVGRGRGQLLSHRNTLAVDHHHPLRPFAPPCRPHGFAPFFAEAKLPSAKLSRQSRLPCSSNSDKNARQISSHRPASSHLARRRQQVLGLGYSSGRSCHRAPVLRIHRMPSSTRRSSQRGRPPLRPGLAGGNSGSIFAHCSSVNSGYCVGIGTTLRRAIYLSTLITWPSPCRTTPSAPTQSALPSPVCLGDSHTCEASA